MRKKFNITGICRPAKHYMADITDKLNQTVQMVEAGDYFVIHRPRQYGKTTLLYTLASHLRKQNDYTIFNISFEGIGDIIFEDEASFASVFFNLLKEQAEVYDTKLLTILDDISGDINNLKALSKAITYVLERTEKKVVVLIDEVDKSSNNQLFISFLAMLRSKYLAQDDAKTFHSVILAGLNDVKTLKSKIHPDSETKYNSPWNIAADFKVVMELQPNDIVPMLKDYSQERGVSMDFQAIADVLFYYTSGYPFLVSALCKIADEDILPTKTEQVWTVFDIELAADKLIRLDRSTTNFDTLIKNLENNPDLYDLVYRLIIENEFIPYNPHAPLINFGLLHGIFRNGQGLNIHNRIYREVIVNYMTAKAITERQSLNIEATMSYLLANNELDMRKVLLKFQELMKIEYSTKDAAFLERHGRLLFLAFLKPILNGKGYTFKEPEISEERRMDIAVSFFQHKYIVELKLWHGDKAHKNGLKQLADYLDRQLVNTGFLVIFENNRTKSWRNGWIRTNGKRVFAIWV